MCDNNNDIDINLYDRQIRTYGMDALNKINNSSVLIIGLAKGLGTEVGKNLSLSGVKTIYLYDPNPIIKSDLETGYYYNEKFILKKRSDILSEKLKELNPYISVITVNSYKQNQHTTVIINQSVDYVKEVNKYCRRISSKLVVLYSGGISGVIFVDAGKSHIINDINGENIEHIQIKNIDIDGNICCINKHNLQDGDYITFNNMEGINIEIFDGEWEIIVIDKNTFKIKNFNEKKFKFINGNANYIKKSIEISHKPFYKNLKNNSELINMYIKYYNNINNDYTNIINYEIMPVVSLMGSITASEVIKLISNKYTPINQWFEWSDDILLEEAKKFNNIKLSYDEVKSTYGILYGKEFEDGLINSKWFIVGSGAIGCEYLKNMAFMGIQDIIITDPDFIEKSNLNRQLLFRNHHIGKSKSEIASNVIKEMKPNMNIKPLLQKVGNDNIEFIKDIMNSNITGVFNALDNLSARKFMDEICFKFKLPLFESGTNGTKGNTQPIIPFITETYSSSNDSEDEETYPVCTIKSFPNKIQHTIHWAINQFEIFNKDNIINEINLYNIIKFSFDMFNENYNISINKLLDEFKPDYEISEGVLFWSGGKICPKPIYFDINNKLHMDYILSTIDIISDIYSLNIEINNNDIINFINNNKISEPVNNLYKINNQEFNKDNNKHMKWITTASNLRAINYGIPIISEMETKGIAGKIIPAVSTTTSAVSGLILLEMLKYLLKYDKVDYYRSTFINLVQPMIIQSEPIQAPIIEIAGNKFNYWTKFDYDKNTTLLEFKNYYENIFKLNINMIVIETTLIYAEDVEMDNLNKLLSNIIIDIYDKYIDNISITIMSDEIELPNINLILEN